MPWKEVLAPEARMRLVLAYREKRESFSLLCRRFGISRKSAYKWLKRYRAGGVQALRDRPRRPGYCPKAYRSFWRERLVKAREARPQWGAKKLRSVLRKTFPGVKRVPAVSTLALWLRQSGLARKRKRRAWRGPLLACRALPVARRCNELWSVDFKGWFRTRDGRRCEPLTVRDVFSRFVLTAALLPNQSDAAVRRAMRQVFRRYGLPKAIRVDNGAPFGGRGALGLSRLSVWWLRLGIAVEFIRRAHPQDNAAHEQMHRIFKADAASPPAGTFRAQKRRTNAWIKCYNYERPHEALGQRVPGRIYWPSNQPMPEQLPKVNYPRAWDTRRVRNRGHIKWRGRERFVGRAFVGELVGLKKIAEGIQEVYLDSHLIGLLYDQDLAGMRPASIVPHP
ncbi:MAG TPA: helix-turn-helix domain-containing protein [Candidatus Binatia bacterium]|nr:helix-turn-helix domain-containing protein [Candidatus Binatia bacterium]